MANLAAAAGDWANALNLAGATTAIVEAADLVFSPPEEATMANIRLQAQEALGVDPSDSRLGSRAGNDPGPGHCRGAGT